MARFQIVVTADGGEKFICGTLFAPAGSTFTTVIDERDDD